MGSRWIFWVDFEMILRSVVDGAVRKEFGSCEKSIKFTKCNAMF